MIILGSTVIDKIFLNRRWHVIKYIILPVVIVVAYSPFLKNEIVHFNKKELYDFISTLPKKALIAGHPEEMDEIPLIAKRKVLFNMSCHYLITKIIIRRS